MLLDLNFILLHVPDLAKVIPFYTEKLGLAIETQVPGFVQFKLPATGGAIFAITQEGDSTPVHGVELWWRVDDTDATYADLKARDVEIVDQPQDQPFGRTLSIKDPAGNTLYMFQPRQ